MITAAQKAFSLVLDNYEDLDKELRNHVINNIGINTKNEKLKEYVEVCIETFDFNIKELEFLTTVRTIIDEELKKIRLQYYAVGGVDYAAIADSLANRLREVGKIDFNIEADLKKLSTQIPDRFPSCGLTSLQLYDHFMGRKAFVEDIINAYNQELIDSLIKLSPRLLEDFKQQEIHNRIVASSKENTEEKTTSQVHITLVKPDEAIDILIANAKTQYNELQRRLSYLNSSENYTVSSSAIIYEKETIKKALAQLEEFINKLSAGKYTQNIISKISTIEELNIKSDKIIHEQVPSLTTANNLTNQIEEKYGKQAISSYSQYTLPKINIKNLHDKIENTFKLSDLIKERNRLEPLLGTYDYDTNLKLEMEYNILIDKIIRIALNNGRVTSPELSPDPNIGNEIGNSKEDIEFLINSGQYFSVLQAIPKSQVDKYRDFINQGFNVIMKKWDKKASLAKNYEERLKSYREFSEIFNNFRDYLPLEVTNTLNQNLISMEEFLEKSAPNIDQGVRYNMEASAFEQTSVAKRM